jgi:hypothetical protein
MDPLLLEYLQRQNPGLELPAPLFDRSPAAPPLGAAAQAPQPPLAQPPAPPPVLPPALSPTTPPPTDFRALLYRNLGDMTKQLGPDFSPEALRSAQQQDIGASGLRTLGDSLTRGAMLVRNKPVSETAPVNISNEAVQRLMQRRGDVLGTAEAATKLQGMLLQQSLMDPNSPMSQARQEQMLRLDPEFVAKRYGGPEGLRRVPGFLIDQDMAMREKLADVGVKETTKGKLGAEAEGAIAEALIKRRSVEKVSPDFVSEAKRNLQISLTPDMTYGEADKRISEALTARGQNVELMKWNAEHSPNVAPGVLYTGPGVPNADEAKDFRDRLATTSKLHGLLNSYGNLVASTSRAGKIAGPDAARLRVVHGEIVAEIRSMIGGAKGLNVLTDSDTKLADDMAPPAAGVHGLTEWTPSTLAAIETLKQHSAEGVRKVGESRFYHMFDPKAALGQPAPGAAPAPAEKPAPPPSWRPD